MSGLLGAIKASSEGLSVQRNKMNVVAKNIANAETTETAEGGPYRRQRVMVEQTVAKEPFNSVLQKAKTNLTRTHEYHRGGGVRRSASKIKVTGVDSEKVTDPVSSYQLVHDPTHPHADEDGYVKMPDIEIINEMVDMIAATRAYEANTVAISSAKKMVKDALDI
jgi:flagellar basal-body rod protein FlgC